MRLAAICCPRCPSNSAEWAPVYGIDTDQWGVHKIMVGGMFQ